MVTAAKTLQPVASKAPNAPIAPVVYSQLYTDQLTNAYRLYFTQLDALNQLFASRINAAGILFPDQTQQKTAYLPGSIEVYDRSASIAVTTTPTILAPASQMNANGITYTPATGVFTWQYAGSFALSLVVNAVASSAGQTVYIYAQSNTGSGWTNIANSGKSYQLANNQITQVIYAQAVTRAVGQQIRYFIYSNGSNVTLQTSTMPGVTPTVYIPAIRIQYA